MSEIKEFEKEFYDEEYDMFWGHSIEIFVDAEGNITSADIAG